MGIYLNPPADGFEDILKDGFYVDKTRLITYTNQVMGTSRKLTCFSRPRRFGKSYAAQMLVAFYSKGADSRHLFENMKVRSTVPSRHLRIFANTLCWNRGPWQSMWALRKRKSRDFAGSTGWIFRRHAGGMTDMGFQAWAMFTALVRS